MTHKQQGSRQTRLDWLLSFLLFPYNSQKKPEPNSTNQALQSVSTKVEFMVSKHFPVSKSQDVVATTLRLAPWLPPFVLLDL